jgi:ubiquitin-conjugating enzyme E2 variant
MNGLRPLSGPGKREITRGALPPALDELAGARLIFSALSIAAAALLLGALGVRLALRVDVWHWWVPLLLVGGIAAADFGSGLVHWAADTWGRDDLPVIGRRLLVPFRVHHVNPDDFTHRRFVDTNGDVAFIAALVLASLLVVPLEPQWGRALGVFGFGCCGIGMMTNQIHQWAHLPSPPRAVRALQACRLLLRRDVHAAHHEHPYDVRYCITTGWCNGPLEAVPSRSLARRVRPRRSPHGAGALADAVDVSVPALT